MLDRFLYRVMYWLRITHWDTGETPMEVREAFQTGDFPPGAALDLGCGTGTNTIFMAQQGRQAIGLDFVPEAIVTARRKALQAGIGNLARFLVADVSQLDRMDLPQSSFALDMGCFHSLKPGGQRRYTEGLVKSLVPGGRYMLYTLDPRKEAGFSFGIKPEAVKVVFEPWFDIVRIERGGSGFGRSTWFWMERKKIEKPKRVFLWQLPARPLPATKDTKGNPAIRSVVTEVATKAMKGNSPIRAEGSPAIGATLIEYTS